MKNFLRTNKSDPLYENLKHELALIVHPRAIRLIGKLRPWNQSLKFLKKIHLRSLFDYLKPKPGLIIEHRIKTIPFNEYRKFIFMQQLWNADFDYSKTDWYAVLRQKIDKGQTVVMPVKGYHISNHEQLDRYCLDYVSLLKSMHQDGYLPEKGKDELGVIIGPDGELIKSSKGRHRLAAAQITGVKEIPVRVKHIHKQWVDSQKIRTRSMDTSQLVKLALDRARAMHLEPGLLDAGWR